MQRSEYIILLSISSSTMTGVHGLWFVAVLLFVTSTTLVTVGKCVCVCANTLYAYMCRGHVCAMYVCVLTIQ